MRFQFTIAQLLFATAMLAAVLGLFAPFDAVSLPFAIPISCTVFGLLLLVQPQTTIEERMHSSMRQAIVSGVWRGAFLGGKWMAVIAGTFVLLLWVMSALLGHAAPANGVYVTIAVMAGLISAAAVVGAFIVGIAEAVNYRRRSTHSNENDQS